MSTLLKAITSTDTTLMVADDSSLPRTNGTVQLESETVTYTENYMGTLYGCLRGANGTTATSHAIGVTLVLTDYYNAGQISGPVNITSSDTVVGHSFQPASADLTLDPAAGSSDASNPKYHAASFWNIFGDSLTKSANYLAGVIGAFSITGTKATSYPTGAVLAQITDGVTAVDGAVTAYIDGDSSTTIANAAFKAMSNNSNPGSGFNYGVDLNGAAHDSYPALAILKADIRMSHEVCIFSGAGAPTDGVTGANFAEIGSIFVRRDTGKMYVNGGTKASPAWKLVTSA